MHSLDSIRTYLLALPSLAKFAIALAIIVGVPPLSHRVRLPAVVGLLIAGIIIGPHGLELYGKQHPVVDFFAELGKLLLMFFAGLEIDLELFQKFKKPIDRLWPFDNHHPAPVGNWVALLFGYAVIPSLVYPKNLVAFDF